MIMQQHVFIKYQRDLKKILDKIVANPVQITKQLIRSVMDKDKSSDKNASNKDPEKDKVPSLGNIDDILADLTF